MAIRARSASSGVLNSMKIYLCGIYQRNRASSNVHLALGGGNYAPSTLSSSIIPRDMGFVSLERRASLRKLLGDFG
jgi:hypothetical protein